MGARGELQTAGEVDAVKLTAGFCAASVQTTSARTITTIGRRRLAIRHNRPDQR